MFEETVKNKDGVEKRVVAQSQEELNEAVKAVKAEKSAVAPDIHDPKDGNKIVSPDNAHTESSFERPVYEQVSEDKPEENPEKKAEDKPQGTQEKQEPKKEVKQEKQEEKKASNSTAKKK